MNAYDHPNRKRSGKSQRMIVRLGPDEVDEDEVFGVRLTRCDTLAGMMCVCARLSVPRRAREREKDRESRKVCV